MDAYPTYYVAHNLPFVTLFGLQAESVAEETDPERRSVEPDGTGYSYKSELPPVTGTCVEALVQAFNDLDAQNASWNSRPGLGKMGSVGFTCRNAGEELRLPPHKAPLPSQLEREDLPANWQPVLHSPMSPLTPSSPLYPDGIFMPAWMEKHQALLPTAIICFYTFTIDATRSSLEDNALKTEINRLKRWFSETGYSSRIVVVLVCDEPAPVPVVVERLGNIRRSTNLDTKTLLYMPGGLSNDESRAFVGSLLSNIHGTCLEYYRDLSKHARRKKNRGSTPPPTVPPTSGTSQVLSARGWNLRYEMKLGVFAEFRGEMEAAERSFEQAYEDLMDGDVLASTSNWSPRFNEARMLADVIAIRILRCLLWTNQTTAAAQSWANHKYRMQDFVDKKGKGTGTYGWQAWEATWSTVMAEIIEKVQIPFFNVQSPTDESPLITANIYAPAERTVAKDAALSPWDYLHHQGYWYNKAARMLRRRQALARGMPEEDRRAPGESPASALASRSHVYDDYLCPQPHQEYIESVKAQGLHSELILSSLGKAESHIEKRHQIRAAVCLKLEMVKELAEQGRWNTASDIVKSMLSPSLWRQGGWWQLLNEVYLLAFICFKNTQDAEMLISVVWQMQSTFLHLKDEQRPSLAVAVSDLDLNRTPRAKIEYENTIPCLAVSFTFGTENACVGDPLQAQLTITPYLATYTPFFILSSLVINFKGSVGKVCIRHQLQEGEDSDGLIALQKVKLEQEEPSTESENRAAIFSGFADLTLTPEQAQIFHFNVIPRESQDLEAVSVEMVVVNEVYEIEFSAMLQEPVSRILWWDQQNSVLVNRFIDLKQHCKVDVKPRPPKLQIVLPDLREAYYTDEATRLTIKVVNEEAEPADVRLKVHVIHGDIGADIRWADSKESHALVSETGSALPQRDIGIVAAASSADLTAVIEELVTMGKITFEIEAVYTLAEDPNTIITKSFSQELSFVRPFEAKYESRAGLHPDPWPSYFSVSDSKGLLQRAYITAKILPYTTEPILVEDIELKQTEPPEESILCSITSDRPEDGEPVTLQPQELRSCTFTIDSQKRDAEDKKSCAIQFYLSIRWQRQISGDESDRPINTTILPASTLSLDFGRPRALASARLEYPPGLTSRPILHMTYTMENPSVYLLHLNVSMDATEQFAFAGPKLTTLQLAPFSRGSVTFTLLPFARGVWISPMVRVNDVGFSESLRIHAAEGVRNEKGRCLVWIPDDADPTS